MTRFLAVIGMLMLAAPAYAQVSLLPTLERIRAEYPTPMSPEQLGEFLNRVAWEHRFEGWGLLEKGGGNRCPAPQGVDVSCDILIHAPSIHHFDVLVDSEGAATPVWRDVGPCVLGPSSGCAMSNYLAPVSPQPTAPFGSFDTPIHGSTVTGSVAVTGWALDDVEVNRVEIWRDLVPGETTPPYPGPGPGTGKVFIGNAFFVPGARPDVEAAHPTSPMADRAGWGYLLLTWGLWNQGNGSYVLHAFAFDADGNASTLGTKTVTSSNAQSIKPLGAIDTPGYGEIRSGAFWNYGWALTSQPNATDPRTCTIQNGSVSVGIDSGPLMPVNYGDLRSDIAAAFPGFSNQTSAGGAFYLDTTTLTDGLHQIGWLVTDNCGRTEGIGSRFFTVLNGPTVVPGLATATAAAPAPDLSLVSGPAVRGEVTVRRLNGDWTTLAPHTDGTFVLSVAEGERVEVQLPSGAGRPYAGNLVGGQGRDPLPAGSSLDGVNGVFRWQPAAGFLGAFPLEFTAAGTVVRVRVVVGPSMRMAVDVPQPGAVEQPIRIAGWALDLAALDGPGIDAIHAWAYPASGGEPTFIGATSSRDARPDVAAIYGSSFDRSAFDLVATRLPPGVYDVVVYARRTASGTFDGAHVVRVMVR